MPDFDDCAREVGLVGGRRARRPVEERARGWRVRDGSAGGRFRAGRVGHSRMHERCRMRATPVWSFWVVCGSKVVVHLLHFGGKLEGRMELMMLLVL